MKTRTFVCALIATSFMTPAFAQDHDHHNHADHHMHLGHSHDHGQASLLTPASVMGDHVHEQGEWMLSYRFKRMKMDGNRNGTNELNPDEISGVFENVTSTGPATLRIVPTEMTMDMHMIGAMYAPTDWLTLMAMGHYMDKEMDHITFSGADPTVEIGRFTTNSEGIGDTKVAGLFQAYESGAHSVVFKAGLSLPTGSIDEEGIILNPMGVRKLIRLPYAMQLGSGTYDFEPALTYSAHDAQWGWGAQYNGVIRTSENDEDYTLGDIHRVQGWVGYQWQQNLGTTLRLLAETEDEIDGQDSQISGPVQTANPDNYGGERVELGFGVNFEAAANHTLGAEFTLPVYQDLNGPQMQRDYAFTFAYRFSF